MKMECIIPYISNGVLALGLFILGIGIGMEISRRNHLLYVEKSMRVFEKKR